MESNEQTVTVKQKTLGKRLKRRLRKAIIWTLVAVLAAGAVLLCIGMLRQEYTVSYDGYQATVGSITNALSFSGSMALVNSKTYTASAASTVRTVYVQAGDDVKNGDALLRLSNGERVNAEFDGRVNSLPVKEGDSVEAGATLVQVADFTNMKVSIRVDEYDISSVSVGQACTITATATEKTFETNIAAIDYISASSGNVAYYTALAYVSVDEGVYPGMQATITIPQEEAKNVVVLKMDALSFDESNNAFVYLQSASGEMVENRVEVGISNGNYVEIKQGLSQGQEVFVQAQETQTASGISGLLSGLFGNQRVNSSQGGGTRTRNTENVTRNWTNPGFPGGTQP